MNLATGVFIAPRPGRYFFSFSGLSKIENTPVYIYLNGVRFGASYGVFSTETYSLQSTLSLQMGDQITLMLAVRATYENAQLLFTHFTGILLEEDIF